jgi:hypothetical protein
MTNKTTGGLSDFKRGFISETKLEVDMLPFDHLWVTSLLCVKVDAPP